MKLIFGLFSGSATMISEAYHSFADTFNQILLALGIRQSAKKPDLQHPFGYAKKQFFWSFVVAILIFGISGTLAFLEGVEILLNPDAHHLETDRLQLNIIVLLIAIILEGYAFRTAYGEAKVHKEKMKAESIFEALEEMQDPVLLSLLIEDALALIGLIAALIGVVLTIITGNTIIDGYTSLLIGIILMTGGLILAKENQTYLIGRSVTTRIQQTIKDIVLSHESVKKLISMKTMLLSPKDMIITLDIDFTDEVEEGKIAENINEIEKNIIKVLSEYKLSEDKIFIEAQ